MKPLQRCFNFAEIREEYSIQTWYPWLVSIDKIRDEIMSVFADTALFAADLDLECSKVESLNLRLSLGSNEEFSTKLQHSPYPCAERNRRYSLRHCSMGPAV